MEEGGKNRTPDKLPASETKALEEACDAHLARVVDTLEPKWLVGVGAFAQKKAEVALAGKTLRIGKILHPSPASPAANRGWAEAAAKQLDEQRIW
jgi:single-strand selective monofunctional uracil DNA glycosylase